MLAQLFFQGYISFISSTVWAFRRLSNYPDVDYMLMSRFTDNDHSIFSSSSWVSQAYMILALSLDLFIIIIFYVWMVSLHVCLCTIRMPGAYRGQERESYPMTRVTDTCEPRCGFWDTNQDPLESIRCPKLL